MGEIEIAVSKAMENYLFELPRIGWTTTLFDNEMGKAIATLVSFDEAHGNVGHFEVNFWPVDPVVKMNVKITHTGVEFEDLNVE